MLHVSSSFLAGFNRPYGAGEGDPDQNENALRAFCSIPHAVFPPKFVPSLAYGDLQVDHHEVFLPSSSEEEGDELKLEESSESWVSKLLDDHFPSTLQSIDSFSSPPSSAFTSSSLLASQLLTPIASPAPMSVVSKGKQVPNAIIPWRIEAGLDMRTTCMFRNIPNKFSQRMLIDFLNETHMQMYDFVYLRMDFKNRCNVGYAFINFVEPR